MITREQNALLTLSGPGTAMGELFRRYWIPALLADELPEPDCPPVRGRLPRAHVYVSKRWQECNYLQAMEGGIDSSHVSFLHRCDRHRVRYRRVRRLSF